MKWVSGPGWHMQSSGDYAITKHAIADKPGEFFYIAWWKQGVLSASCDTAEAARGVCAEHSEKRN